MKIYRVDISNLPIYHNVINDEADELFYRYIKTMYREGRDSIYDKYFCKTPKTKELSTSHRMIIRGMRLKWNSYSQYKGFKFIREYKIEDLLDGGFTLEELGYSEMYEISRIEFEAYLFAHLQQEIYWKNFSGGDFNKFVSGEWFFIKHCVRGVSIVLVREYLIK